jgi:OmpA-OmpF porin, OOP family
MNQAAIALFALITFNAGLARAEEFPAPRDSWRQAPATLVPLAFARMTIGMPKRQVYQVLGAPHFDEGLRSHQWHYWYLGPARQECLLQVRYDRHMRVETLHWNAQACDPTR